MNKKKLIGWNNSQLSANGIKERNNTAAQMIVRSVGDAKTAKMFDDKVIERVDSIFVDGYGLVKCAPYELHFIFELPKEFQGWGLYCTCGSIAGVVGFSAYSKLAAPTVMGGGHMLVCLHHTSTKNNVGLGEHGDGSHE